ncbi:MAG TPA: hypothetical protein VJ770_14970 [Stellaceae bacterium]|nr:hypothetical protein [Stellaceae bacterium]
MQIFVICGRLPHLVKKHCKTKLLTRGVHAFPKAFDLWVVDVHQHKIITVSGFREYARTESRTCRKNQELCSTGT